MSGLYREEPVGEGLESSWLGQGMPGRDLGCSGNLEARPALVCKI